MDSHSQIRDHCEETVGWRDASKIVEDGVHEARCGEVSKNFKRKLSPLVCWDALAHGGLASKVHHFKDVGTGGQVLCCV